MVTHHTLDELDALYAESTPAFVAKIHNAWPSIRAELAEWHRWRAQIQLDEAKAGEMLDSVERQFRVGVRDDEKPEDT